MAQHESDRPRLPGTRRRTSRLWLPILPGVLLLAGRFTTLASAQDGPAVAVPPPTEATASATAASLDALLKRLDQLEATNARLVEELGEARTLRADFEKLSKQYDELSRTVRGASQPPGVGIGVNTSPPGTAGVEPGAASALRPRTGGLKPLALKATYDQEKKGFRIEDEDREFSLRVRGLVQADARIYRNNGNGYAESGLFMPRVRLTFDGRITKPIEYQISIQRSLGNFDVLNAYIDWNVDPRLQFRIGRYKVPYTYEFYTLDGWSLLAPERSIFNVNFALNRQIGAMAKGELFDKKLEYAVGIFDGPRNSYFDYNSAKDVTAYLNYRPFRGSKGLLDGLNVGGSADWGTQDNPLVPNVFRTSLNATSDVLGAETGANQAAVPFLAFNPNVRERGPRALWELHALYTLGSFSALASWDAGVVNYAAAGRQPVGLLVGGFNVQASYFLTGESAEDRSNFAPARPFSLRAGKRGPGAIEPFARISGVDINRQVFTAGLSDPNLWSNRAVQFDLGVNWYLNRYLKLYFDWEHASFGDPVFLGPGVPMQGVSDQFWMRAQLYF